jgi:MFS family permease
LTERWGIVTTFEYLMDNYSGLLACHFFIGPCEGGLFPGFVLYLSEFYQRHELQTRIGLIYGAASVNGAFSGLLAAAIEKLEGKANLAGWRWIFLLERFFTVVFGVFALLVLPNTPEDVLPFTTEQAEYCTQRLQSDGISNESHTVTPRVVFSAFKEPHLLNIAVISFCNGVIISGLAYFTPSVVQSHRYDTTKTQLLSAPPYAIAFAPTMVVAQFADRRHQRGLAAVSILSLAIVGYALNLTCTYFIRPTQCFDLLKCGQHLRRYTGSPHMDTK